MKCVECSEPLQVGGRITFQYKGKEYECEIVNIADKVHVMHKGKSSKISKSIIDTYMPPTPIKDKRILTCIAPDCKRTSKSHPVNFRGRRSGIPECQGHYIQRNKLGFKEYQPLRNSGKQQMKYDERQKKKTHFCECGRGFNSLQSLHSHKTYRSPKTGKSKCILIS